MYLSWLDATKVGLSLRFTFVVEAAWPSGGNVPQQQPTLLVEPVHHSPCSMLLLSEAWAIGQAGAMSACVHIA